jgi:hypothetical protein
MFILLSSQFPWAYINSSSKGIIEMYLKRSGTNCELDVHLVDPDQEVIDVVTSHKERLGQLHIFLKYNMVYSCIDLFNSPIPSMKSLTLFSDFEQMWFTAALSSRALPILTESAQATISWHISLPQFWIYRVDTSLYHWLLYGYQRPIVCASNEPNPSGVDPGL